MKNKKALIIGILFVVVTMALLIPSLIKKGENKEKELKYEFYYNGLNCLTPYIKLYSDNTYEYFEYYGEDEEGSQPEIGTYYYDINTIIDNIDKYEETPAGPYIIKTPNGNSYTTYNSNIELMEFLNTHNLVLEKCLEQR